MPLANDGLAGVIDSVAGVIDSFALVISLADRTRPSRPAAMQNMHSVICTRTSEKRKSRSNERLFFFFTPYYQNTKLHELECQLSFEILACKLCVMSERYFGEEVRLLTKKEDMAKGGKQG
jgi:hypothetical protein